MSSQNPGDKGDPASRLAEMLAQSLEELTRPASDKPVALAAPKPEKVEPPKGEAAVIEILPKVDLSKADLSRADPKLPKVGPAPELEAWFEQFQKKVQAEPPVPVPVPVPRAEGEAPVAPAAASPEPKPKIADLDGRVMEALAPRAPSPAAPSPAADNDDDILEPAPAAPVTPAPAVQALASPTPEPALDPEAARVVRKVRRLMVVSMLITFIGVGSVFGIIGYRIYKNEGFGGKLFDPKPVAPAAVVTPAVPVEKTLRLPANARILAAGVAEDRLAVTLEIDGKVEIRTFDLTTLEPAARMGFSATP